MAPTTWLQYYAGLSARAGTNPVKTTVFTEAEVFVKVSQSHLDKPDRFRSTISGNAPSSIVLVPNSDGKAQLLHHGTMFAKGIGLNPLALFVAGNRSSAPIKILDIEEACLAIGTGASTSTRPKSLNIPTEDQFYDNATSAASFTALKAEDKNNPLNDRPNHLLLHPKILEIAGGSPSLEANELAWRIIQAVNSDPGTTAEEIALFEKAKTDNYVLLAYLWIISKQLSREVLVSDVGDADDALDTRCGQIRDVLNGTAGANPGGGGGPIQVNVDTSALAATQAALLTTVNVLNTSLLASDAEKKAKKSVLHGMAPNSRRLFERLCTTDIINTPPVMPPFLKSLIGEKNPSYVATHLRSVTKDSKGTFMEGAFCRFLYKGYVSQRDTFIPAGFTIFMFLPKECEPARDSFKENREQICQLWSQKMDEDTINRLARTDLFLCENVHHLEIQLETALLVLEAMTVVGGCATSSLFMALRFVKNHSSIIARLTMLDKLLPAKIAYRLDLELQKWFSIVCDHEGPMTNIRRRDAYFHEDQLQTWLYAIEMHHIPNVILPQELVGVAYDNPLTRQVSLSDSDDDESTSSPKKKRARKSTKVPHSRTSCEGKMSPIWKLPNGVDYDAVFKGDNLRGWPSIQKGPAERRGRTACVRFHATGKCHPSCGFSHAFFSEIEPTAVTKMTAKFKKIYLST